MTYKDPFGKEHRYGPPKGWVQPAQQSLGPDDWDEIVKRGLEFEPYDGAVTISTTSGDCLAPLLVGGNHYLKLRAMTPDESLVDGGLYVVQPEEQEAMRILIREKLGIVKTGVVTIAKFLRYSSFEWWCVNREGIDKLGMGYVTHQVVGVITIAALAAGCGDAIHAHAHPCGNPFDAASPLCSELGLNAATTLSMASAAGVGVGTSNVGATYVIVSVTVGPYPYATSVVVTATGTWTADPTHPTSAVNFSIATAINSLPNNIQVQPIVASQQGVIAAEQTFALAMGATQTYYLNGVSDPPSAPLAAYSASATIKAETIKR